MLIACWGVPGRSYPDNGNRCLAAAVEMHASLQAKEMKTSMGVTTGHVRAHIYFKCRRISDQQMMREALDVLWVTIVSVKQARCAQVNV